MNIFMEPVTKTLSKPKNFTSSHQIREIKETIFRYLETDKKMACSGSKNTWKFMSLIVVTRSHLENISLYFPNLRFPQKLISEGIPFGPPETMSSLERDHELRLCFFHKRYTTPQVFQLINRNMQGSWPIHNTGDFLVLKS